MTTAINKTERLPALDFTKGALVLFMVLYHWLNYFVGSEGSYYKYLRFLTPSFIFISGFLISHVYLSKYQVTDPRLPKRLLIRGLKILGIFMLLNASISLIFPDTSSFKNFSAGTLKAIYVTGMFANGRAAAFCVLVPISYLLILSAGLLIACRFYRNTFHVAAALFILLIFVLRLYGIQSVNLDLLTIGLLGTSAGYAPIRKINDVLAHTATLLLLNIFYTVAITIWNVSYPLQIVGVCLTVMLIYLVGTISGESGGIQRLITLLGKYSLFAYIAQIAILQILHRGLRDVTLGPLSLSLSFIVGMVLTVITVEAVVRARARAVLINRLYTAVFS